MSSWAGSTAFVEQIFSVVDVPLIVQRQVPTDPVLGRGGAPDSVH